MTDEIDGPPKAWFELNGKRYTYITYAAKSRHDLPGAVELGELMAMAARKVADLKRGGNVIVWRVRPQIRSNEDDWSVYMRAVAVPSPEIYNGGPMLWDRPEGSETPEANLAEAA